MSRGSRGPPSTSFQDTATALASASQRLTARGGCAGSVEAMRLLNSKYMNYGLKDTKIAAMQYEDGLLYILYDNEQVCTMQNGPGPSLGFWLVERSGG